MQRDAPTGASAPVPRGHGARRRALARLLVVAGGGAVPVACSAAFVPLRAHLPNIDLALALVGVVMALSTSGRAAVGVASSITASLSFEFFATEPYDRLAIARQPDLATTVVLALVALAAGECARRVVRQRAASARQRAHFDTVRSAARMLADGAEPVAVVGVVAREIREMLELRECRYVALLPEHGATRVTRDGSLVATDGASPAGPPVHWAELPVFAQGTQVGYFALHLPPGPVPRAERLRVAVTLADQVGAALSAYGPSVAPPADRVPGRPGLHLLS